MWSNKWRGLDVKCVDGDFYVRLRDLERKFDRLTAEEQAKIILKHIERYISVDVGFEEFYLKAIMNGLAEISRQ